VTNPIAVVLDRRWVLIAFGAVLCAALFFAELMDRHDLENRTVALRRENLGLEIKQLASAIEQQSYELEAAARAIAENDGLADWALAKDPQPAPRVDGKSAEQRGIDGLVIATPAQVVRYGAAIVGGRLVDRAPEPDAVQYLDSVAAAAAAGGDPGLQVGFVDDEFIAVLPLMVRGSTVPVGWLAATRSLSPALLARLREAAGGSLTGSPMREIQPLPADVRAWLGAHLGDTFGVSSKIFDDLSGYAVLRDVRGRPAWVFRLDPGAGVAGGLPLQGAHRSDQRRHRHRRCGRLSHPVLQSRVPEQGGIYAR
jgi:hypothetical protein